jgi:hypothetical protein
MLYIPRDALLRPLTQKEAIMASRNESADVSSSAKPLPLHQRVAAKALAIFLLPQDGKLQEPFDPEPTLALLSEPARDRLTSFCSLEIKRLKAAKTPHPDFLVRPRLTVAFRYVYETAFGKRDNILQPSMTVLDGVVQLAVDLYHCERVDNRLIKKNEKKKAAAPQEASAAA